LFIYFFTVFCCGWHIDHSIEVRLDCIRCLDELIDVIELSAFEEWTYSVIYEFLFGLNISYFYISDVNWELLYRRERRRSGRLISVVQKVRQDLEAYRSHTKGLKRKIDYYKYKWIITFQLSALYFILKEYFLMLMWELSLILYLNCNHLLKTCIVLDYKTSIVFYVRILIDFVYKFDYRIEDVYRLSYTYYDWKK
jgi:hypothetical protein